MGQPQQEVYTDLEVKSTNLVQTSDIFFSEISQIVNFVNSSSFTKEELVKRLENTEKQGYTLYQP